MLAQYQRNESIFVKLVRFFLSDQCTVSVHLLENTVQSADATLNIEASADVTGIFVKYRVKLNRKPLQILQTLMHEFVHFLRANQTSIDHHTREYLSEKYLDITLRSDLKETMIREEQLALWVEMNIFHKKTYCDIKTQMENIYCSSSDYESHCHTLKTLTVLTHGLLPIKKN
jgi:hypothetical protein